MRPCAPQLVLEGRAQRARLDARGPRLAVDLEHAVDRPEVDGHRRRGLAAAARRRRRRWCRRRRESRPRRPPRTSRARARRRPRRRDGRRRRSGCRSGRGRRGRRPGTTFRTNASRARNGRWRRCARATRADQVAGARARLSRAEPGARPPRAGSPGARELRRRLPRPARAAAAGPRSPSPSACDAASPWLQAPPWARSFPGATTYASYGRITRGTRGDGLQGRDAVGARRNDGQRRDRQHRQEPGGAGVGARGDRVREAEQVETANVHRWSRRHALAPIQERT